MGKHKYIETPEKLWKMFIEYVAHVKDNPRIKVEYVGRDGDRVETPIERPLTIEGFMTFCWEKYSTIDHYFKNTNDSYNEYRPIITRIKAHIKGEQLDGGLTGFYNSNLTARVTGYADKRENDNKNEHTIKDVTVNVKHKRD